MEQLIETKTLATTPLASRLASGIIESRHTYQKHTSLILTDQDYLNANQVADGLFTKSAENRLAVCTADCVPIFMADGRHHGIAHAGWRGTKGGIAGNLLSCFLEAKQVHVHLGPAICGKCFEVGPDVYQDWLEREPHRMEACLSPSPRGGDRRMLDLRQYLYIWLIGAGIPAYQISISPLCTYESPELPSYRRDRTDQRLWHIIGPQA